MHKSFFVSLAFGFVIVLGSFLLLPESTKAAPGTWVYSGTGGIAESSMLSSYTPQCSSWNPSGGSCDTASSPYCYAIGAPGGCSYAPTYWCYAVDVYACQAAQGCSYSGALSWGGGCSTSGSWSAPSGGTLSADNSASGYTGSISYSCNNGSWSYAGASCVIIVPPSTPGCTDPSASNYNPSATVDNGSCTYIVYGCTDPSATNYNPSANTNNGSCTYAPCSYSGTLSWGSGCSTSGSWSAPSGGSTSASNSASGYSGSITYSCSNGSWSVSSQSCSQDPVPCNLPWGGTTGSGTSVTAYQSPSVPYGSSCSSQTRTCSNGSLSGTYPYQSCAVESAPVPTASISASPNPVEYGGRATLSWSSSNATSCTAGGPWTNGGSLSGSGLTDSLTSSATYTFQCSGPGGTSNLSSVTVNVTIPACSGATPCGTPGSCYAPDCAGTCGGSATDYNGATVGCGTAPASVTSFSPSSATVAQGNAATLTWSSANATSCTGTGFTAGGTSGSASTGALNTPGTNNFQIVCTGPGGSSSPAFTSVNVVIPSVSISASVPRVKSTGGPSTISWAGTDVASCSVVGPGINSSALSGSQTVNITQQSTYRITCDGITNTVTVNVAPTIQEF